MTTSLPEDKISNLVERDPQKIELSSELQHITQEMYKKNAELAMTNKTLSILQKLDSIILSSLTDLNQVSQVVVDLTVAEAEFKRVSIYIAQNNEGLIRLASSKGEAIARAQYLVKKEFPGPNIALTSENNILVRAFKLRTMQITNKYYDLVTPDFSQEEADLIQKTLNVKSVFVYPLIVRSQAIGVISISLVEEVAKVSEYEQDLINRLVDVIGIAIDNSLLYKEIQAANDKLKELDKLKDEFVSLASHELRTPMTVIKSYIWLILNGKTGEISQQQRKYLETTYGSVEGLIHLVNDMLDISRIESGRIVIEKSPFDLGNLLAEKVTLMVSRGDELGIKIDYIKPPEAMIVNADAEKITQVAINLIGNSLKFTPKGGLIKVTAVKTGDGFVRVDIIDSGRGMSSADISKLFQKFSMVGDTHLTQDKGQGTGLGLYLSKSLIELHGGKIWAASAGEGKGATFSFTIPLAASEAPVDINLPPQSNPRV